jgi:DNA-binding XRE family transcriptional regulator
LDSIKNGTRVIFIHGVCGTGKSAIALNIAKELGVSLATYGSIERGTAKVKKPMAKFIADYFEITLEEAFFIEANEQHNRFFAKANNF